MTNNTPGEIRAAVMQIEEQGGLPTGLLQALYEHGTGYRHEQTALPKHRQNGQNKETEIVDAGLRLQEKMGEFGNNKVLGTHAFMYGDKRTSEALQNGFSQDEIDNTLAVLARVGKYGGEPLSNDGLIALSKSIGVPSRDLNPVAKTPPPKPVVPKVQGTDGIEDSGFADVPPYAVVEGKNIINIESHSNDSFGDGNPKNDGIQRVMYDDRSWNVYKNGQLIETIPPQNSQETVAEPSKQVAVNQPNKSPSAFNLPDIMNATLSENNGRYATGNPLLDGIMHIESRGNTNAVSPTGATGLFQFTRGTGKQYGLVGKGFDHRKDPIKNLEAMKRLVADNAKALQKNGIPITPANIYMAHQQGVGGTIAIYKAAANGTGVPANIRRNMDLNGGKGLTPAQFINKWNGKANRAVTQAGGAVPQGNTMAQGGSLMGSLGFSNTPSQTTEAVMPNDTPTQQTNNAAQAITQRQFVDVPQTNWQEIAKKAFDTKRQRYVPKYVSQAVRGVIKGV